MGEGDAFDARQYWEQRLAVNYGLGGVGYAGLGEPYNEWMYRVRRFVFQRVVRRYLPSHQTLDVLDVGSGTGFYVDLWKQLGVRSATGSDLTEKAVSELKQRWPEDDFVRFDVGAPYERLPFDRGFGAVSAIDVLFHIVDDDAFQRAFFNLHELILPGGTLILSDNFVHHKVLRLTHHVSRGIDATIEALRAPGFMVERRVPMFVLMNQPVDSMRRLHHMWWGWLERRLHQSPEKGQLVGAALYPLELMLTAVLREGPSTELMVCRRP